MPCSSRTCTRHSARRSPSSRYYPALLCYDSATQCPVLTVGATRCLVLTETVPSGGYMHVLRDARYLDGLVR
eukprot:1322658-Rhodomonas_salina.1